MENSNTIDIANLRKNYSLAELTEEGVNSNPILQFSKWFKEAVECGVDEPNAMTLATATREGVPSARIVLLKGIENDKFIFFTNYNSRKGKELSENPNAALVFLWKELERQVRITGTVQKISTERSSEYFKSRPYLSRIGAWASNQSSPVLRTDLIDNFNKFQNQFPEDVPLPPHWGGYELQPHSIEFWQGRQNRMHDRLLYTRNGSEWEITRLAP